MTHYKPEKYSYDKFVVPYQKQFVRVVLSEETMLKIERLAKERADAKLNSGETHHEMDGGNEVKRNITGLKGEFALEKILGLKIVDETIGDSSKYNKPDIEQYGIGIKTVEKGKYPVIWQKNRYPQIICITSDYKPDLVFVCGLATPNILNQYQTEELILSENLYNRHVKAGFYGFDHLVPLTKDPETNNAFLKKYFGKSTS